MSKTAIFIKIPGASGSVTAKGFDGWIEVQSLHHHANIDVDTKVGNTKTRVQSQPQVGEFHLTMKADESKVKILDHFYNQKSIDEVEIKVCSTGKELTPYLIYKLQDVIISNRSIAIDGLSDKPMVSISLNTTKVQERFIPTGSGGRAKGPVSAGYNISKGETL